MQHIAELVRVVTEIAEVEVDILPNEINEGSDPYSKLCRIAKKPGLRSEVDAENLLLGTKSNSGQFRTIKSRTRRKLLNLIFFLKFDEKRISQATISYYDSYRRYFLVKILMRVGARQTAIKIAESTLRAVEKYELTNIRLDLLFELRGHYALIGRHNEFIRINRELKRTLRLLEAEYQVIELYQSLSHQFIRSVAEQPHLVKLAKEHTDTVGILRSQSPSFTTNLYYFRIAVLYSQVARFYSQTLATCDEAIEYLKTQPTLTAPANLGEFQIYRLEGCLYLRNYEEGIVSAEECAKYFAKGLNNWFIYMESYFLLAMHTRHFDQAKVIYEEVINHPRLQVQPEVRREKWKVFELYLHYSLNDFSKMLDKYSRSKSGPNLSSFLRNIPTYSQDKRGYNISILIIHILYLLDHGDRSGIIDRMEAIKTYRSRYLRVSSNRQSALFFKLLLIMESSNFDYEQTRKKSAKYFARLKQLTADYTEVQDSLQILPFDWLWQQVLEKLKNFEVGKQLQVRSVAV